MPTKKTWSRARRAHPLQPLPDAPYLKDKHIQAAGGPSVKLLETYRQTGGGPPYVKLSRAVYYPKDLFLEWMAARLVTDRKREVAHV